MLREVASAVNASLDLPEVLRRVLAAMRDAFGFEHSRVLLPVGDDALEVRASIGYPESGVGVRLGRAEGPVGVVARRKKLLRLASTAVPVRYAQALDPGARPSLTGLPSVKSLIVVPLLDGDELVAVLSIESPVPLTFEQDDEQLVTTVANLAAAAIKNARLFHDLSEMHRSGQRFVPHEFVRFLEKGSLKELARGASVSRVMITLFSDLRSFTSMVEGLDPRATFDLLNHYFAAMVPPIQEHRGFVDKFIGDAIMALFDDVAADGALRAAIEDHRALARFKQERGSQQGSSRRPLGMPRRAARVRPSRARTRIRARRGAPRSRASCATAAAACRRTRRRPGTARCAWTGSSGEVGPPEHQRPLRDLLRDHGGAAVPAPAGARTPRARRGGPPRRRSAPLARAAGSARPARSPTNRAAGAIPATRRDEVEDDCVARPVSSGCCEP